MRGGSYNLELDKENLGRNATYGAQTHSARTVPSPSVPALAPADTHGDAMDPGPLRSLSLTGPSSPFPFGLYGLYDGPGGNSILKHAGPTSQAGS
jgi:hypothetical protein